MIDNRTFIIELLLQARGRLLVFWLVQATFYTACLTNERCHRDGVHAFKGLTTIHLYRPIIDKCLLCDDIDITGICTVEPTATMRSALITQPRLTGQKNKNKQTLAYTELPLREADLTFKWIFQPQITLCYHLLIRMLFKTSPTFLLTQNTKGDVSDWQQSPHSLTLHDCLFVCFIQWKRMGTEAVIL